MKQSTKISQLFCFLFACFLSQELAAQTTIVVPTFETFQQNQVQNRKKAIVKATIFIQHAIDYLYANGGGIIAFKGTNYELGYYSKVVRNAIPWRSMDAATTESFEMLVNAIKRKDSYLIDKYLHNSDSDDHRRIFNPDELKLAVAGEDIYLENIYQPSIVESASEYMNGVLPEFPAQNFRLQRRTIHLAPPEQFVASPSGQTPYIEFKPASTGKNVQVRFTKLRMPKVTNVVASSHLFLVNYINDNYRAIPKKAGGSQARYFLQGLEEFTRDKTDPTSQAVRDLLFPTTYTKATQAAWQSLERWNGCRRLFADFDLFSTFSDYSADKNSPELRFSNCVFDGNIQYAWEDSDKYQFEQASMVFVAGNRQKSGRMVANFENCTWLDAVGDGIQIYNSAAVQVNNCRGANTFRGAITLTGQNTQLHINEYRDISYDKAYYDLTGQKNPRYIGKITVEVDSDAALDEVDYRLTNSFLYTTKIVDERARKDREVEQKGGTYYLENNTIQYAFQQSTPKSRVRIKNCFLGSSQREILGSGTDVANIKFGYAADLLVENCTLQVVEHKIPFLATAPLLNDQDYFVAIVPQDASKIWKKQDLRFVNCQFRNDFAVLERGILIGAPNIKDPLENKNHILIQGGGLIGNFSAAFGMSGGHVTLDGLSAVQAKLPDNKRSYFMRNTVESLNLYCKNMDMRTNSFDFYYYAYVGANPTLANQMIWRNDNIQITEQKNKIKNMKCEIMENIQFEGSRLIEGTRSDPNNTGANDRKMGFANDLYQATNGCLWELETTGCIDPDNGYLINWEPKDPNCGND